ncbi:hypothetical protein [Hymenobacter edaphi]|uniref:Uncharacterized protein n=1 Tax=Hymenobacter edaphi TaxID=2211146 RepID=A0A328BT82_9BACT|nr:hypothetical protein [Hymenobacter edaphi]RAK69885.1 hypothetical protein DLM85_03240 [Hymenobacter edaphi]
MTLNASANNYAKDTAYLKALAERITNKKETKLQGTSRLVIWDRITSGDITFEGKGLVIDNDLFTVGGRANQLLQSLTNKNFGFVIIHSSDVELKAIREKWLGYLSGKSIVEYKPADQPNAKISEISGLPAVETLIISLQPNSVKDQLTKSCLKQLYNLDEMPRERGAQASYCSPDTYTFAYLGMLFGDKTLVESKDAKWWNNFWATNHGKLVWNPGAGIYEVKK